MTVEVGGEIVLDVNVVLPGAIDVNVVAAVIPYQVVSYAPEVIPSAEVSDGTASGLTLTPSATKMTLGLDGTGDPPVDITAATGVNAGLMVPSQYNVISDVDVIAIAALDNVDNKVIQRKGGSLTARTPRQLALDLQLVSTDVTDFVEAAQDAIALLLAGASGVTLNYNDVANTLTITGGGAGGGLDAEAVRDAIGVALVGIGNISVAVNDGLDTITLSTTATVNRSDAATDTAIATAAAGRQPIDSDLTTFAALAPADGTFLGRVAGGWAARTAAQVKTSLGIVSTDVADFVEATQDAVSQLLAGASGVTLSYDDAANTLTITGGGSGGGLDAEAVRDAIGIAIVGVGNMSVVVNDAADTITISTTATVNRTDAATDLLLDAKRPLAPRVTAVTDGATVTINVANTDVAKFVIAGNRTIAFTGTAVDGQKLEVKVKQDATGGRTLTWPASVRWSTDLPSVPINAGANLTTRVLLERNSDDSKWDVLSVIGGH